MPTLLLKKEFWLFVFYLVSCIICGTLGYKVGDNKLTEYKYQMAQKYTEEILRQQRANEAAKIREKELIEKLNNTQLKLDEQVKENELEAAQEPTANDIALPESSIMRINKIR